MLKFKTVTTFCLLILFALVVALFFSPIPLYLFFVPFIIWLTLTCIGSFNILWNYHLQAHHKNYTTKEKIIAITFDDGPHATYTPQILRLLKKFNVKATFFCIGKEIEKYPNLIQQILNDGHVIGNHTYNHSNNFGFMNTKQVIEEINKTNNIIKKTTGKTALFFRPPFGVTNPSIAKAIKITQHTVIGWSIRSLDTIFKNDKKIVNRITSKLTSGDIILLHDTNKKTVMALEQLLLFLQQENYKPVTVEYLLNCRAYE